MKVYKQGQKQKESIHLFPNNLTFKLGNFIAEVLKQYISTSCYIILGVLLNSMDIKVLSKRNLNVFNKISYVFWRYKLIIKFKKLTQFSHS